MSQNRFENLEKHIHFNGNTKALPAEDKKRDWFFKIRPLFEKLRQNRTTQTVPSKTAPPVDEQHIPFNRSGFWDQLCQMV